MVIREPSLRKIQVEKRRFQILDSALLIFAKKGFANTTIKDLANTAGISIGLIYTYFPNKEQLLEAVAERHNFLPQLQELFKGTKEQSCHEALRNIAIGSIRLIEQRDLIIRIFLQEGNTNTKVQQIWSNLIRESVSLLQKHLSDCIKTGELKHHNTEVSARCLLSILIMFHLTRGFFKGDKVTKVQFIDNMLDDIFLGIKGTNK